LNIRQFLAKKFKFVTLDELKDAVTEAVVEDRKWRTVGGDGASSINLADGEAFSGKSIFEHYDSINDGDPNSVIQRKGRRSKKEKKDGLRSLSEAEWAAVGLAVDQDPNIVQSEAKLRLHQSASVWQWINFPIAKSIIENTKRYAIGRGVKVDCPVPEVQNIISNFWKGNSMESRVKNGFREFLIFGEYFLVFFENDTAAFDNEIDPLLLVRSLASGEIKTIEYDPDDRETVLSYGRERKLNDGGSLEVLHYLDATYPFPGDDLLHVRGNSPNTGNSAVHEKDAQPHRMMFLKSGLTVDARGRVLMEPVLRWNRAYSDFVYNRARLNHLRSKIFLIKTRKGSTGKNVDSASAAIPMPKGGMMLVETGDVTYRMVNPDTGAQDAETDIKMLLYMIGSAFGMPIHILNTNAENENYASIREAGNPFAQFIQDIQDDWKEFLESVLRFVITMAIRKGLLDSEYDLETYPDDVVGEAQIHIASNVGKGRPLLDIISEAKAILGEKVVNKVRTVDIPIELIFPEIIKTDPTKLAETLKVYDELGMISTRSAQLKAGLDPALENYWLALEYEMKLQKQEEQFKRFNNGGFEEDDEDEEDEEDSKKDKKGKKDDKEKDAQESDTDPTLNDRSQRYRKKNPDKVSARNALHSAIRSGKIVKPEACQKCKTKGDVHGHHSDYSKPLSVEWLCRSCEVKADNKMMGRKDKEKK